MFIVFGNKKIKKYQMIYNKFIQLLQIMVSFKMVYLNTCLTLVCHFWNIREQLVRLVLHVLNTFLTRLEHSGTTAGTHYPRAVQSPPLHLLLTT